MDVKSFKAAVGQARQEFVDEIEAFMQRTKMSPSRFGWMAIGDPMFVFTIRDGRTPGPKVMDRVLTFIQEQGDAPSRPPPEQTNEPSP